MTTRRYKIAEIWVTNTNGFGASYLGDQPEQGGVVVGYGTGPSFTSVKDLLGFLIKQLSKHEPHYKDLVAKKEGHSANL